MSRFPTHLPAAERRAATVAAVVKLAATRNSSEITTTVIARQMGLTQGALFKHFPTKDAILQAVMEWVADTLMSRVDKAVLGAASPLAALEALFLAHAAFAAEHPGVPRMLFGQLQYADRTGPKRVAQLMLRRYGDRVRALIADGMARGMLNPALDPDAAVVLFIGTIQGLVMQSLLIGDVKRIERDAPRVFAIYRRGIGRVP